MAPPRLDRGASRDEDNDTDGRAHHPSTGDQRIGKRYELRGRVFITSRPVAATIVPEITMSRKPMHAIAGRPIRSLAGVGLDGVAVNSPQRTRAARQTTAVAGAGIGVQRTSRLKGTVILLALYIKRAPNSLPNGALG